ncbi:MAG: toxin-activating lysine-acyltransferase [Novosphingobium sp.]
MNASKKRKSRSAADEGGAAVAAPTISHLLGEMTWLLTQSPLHRAFSIADLEWLVMPALLHQQFYLFRDGDQPVGLAMWAKCSPSAADKLQKGMVEPENRLSLGDWKSGEQVWLVDLIAPFATAENRQREIMIADLISKPLSGIEFRFHQTDPSTGMRTVQTVAADAGARLKVAVDDAVARSIPPAGNA